MQTKQGRARRSKPGVQRGGSRSRRWGRRHQVRSPKVVRHRDRNNASTGRVRRLPRRPHDPVEIRDPSPATVSEAVETDSPDISSGGSPSLLRERLDVDAIVDRLGGLFEDQEDGTILVEWDGELVPYFNQGDEAWRDRKLGVTETIGAAGCAITSIAMVLAFYGRDIDPGCLDDYLDENDGYLGELVRWQVAFQAGDDGTGPQIDYVQHMSADEDGLDTLHEVIDERLEDGMPTIAHVTYERGNHYVVIVGKNADEDYIINDPGESSGAGTMNPQADEALLSRAPRNYELKRLVLHGLVED